MRRGGHGPQRMMPGEKAKDFKGTIRKLINFLGHYKIRLILVSILSLGSTVFLILGPKILGEATTLLFEGVMAQIAGSGGIDFAGVTSILLLTLGLYVTSSSIVYLIGRIMATISTNLAYRLRKQISEKLNRIPIRYFDKTPHGEVLSRITNDVDTINQTMSQTLTEIISSVITIIGVVAMMFSIDWRMTLVALLMVPLSLVFIRLIVKRSQGYFRSQQEYIGKANAHVEEMYGGHMVMKAFNAEERSIRTFELINEELHKSAWKSQFLSGLMMPLMSVVANVGYVVVAVLGGWLAAQRAISVGDVQAFIHYVRNFTQPLMQIANISNVLQQTAAAAERVFAFLEEEQEIEEAAQPLRLDKVEGRVEFERIHFGYTEDKQVIHGFSAKIEPGKKIAIVGPTGAGKSTIVKLLMRFYDIDSGSIKLDGVDIRRMTREDLRKIFAMVLQDTWLYNASVKENIRYGRLDAHDEEVIAAAQAAHVDHFIHTWPNGYDMLINEETSNISQGQKQLLTIARTILADPRVLILDEATSSVDSRTETLIQQAMDRLMEGRTSFVIAHRLSTIRNADLILVMRDGNVIEQGHHQELLAAGGFYSELYNSQFEQAASL